jgi:hypothetical protein
MENQPETNLENSTKSELNLERIFKLVNEFIVACHDNFFEELEQTSKTAFKLYYDLVIKIKETKNDKERSTLITGIIKGFNDFFSEIAKYSGGDTNKFLEEASLLAVVPKKTIIKYKTSDKLYIPISNIIRKADSDSKLVIGQYLFSLDAQLNPTKEKVNQLVAIKKSKPKNPLAEMLGLPEDSEQAEGFGEILNDVVGSLEKSGIDPENALNGTGNVMKTMMAVYNSGVFGKLDEGFKSGKLMNMKDPKSVANMNSMLHNFIDKAMPKEAPPPKEPEDIPLD